MTKTYRSLILFTILLISIAAPRFYANDRTVTVDEWTWMNFSANFYYALGQREFEQTYQDHHPGATTMIAGAAAIHFNFPDYRGLGQGYFTEDALGLYDFLEREGVDQLPILVTARLIMAGFVCAALVGVYLVARKFLNEWAAFLGVGLIALDPYHIGHSRLLTHEALMSVLTLLSFFGFLYFLLEGRSAWALILSGVAGGLAIATKVSGLPILPFIGLAAVVESVNEIGSRKLFWKNVVRPVLFWFILTAAIFI